MLVDDAAKHRSERRDANRSIAGVGQSETDAAEQKPNREANEEQGLERCEMVTKKGVGADSRSARYRCLPRGLGRSWERMRGGLWVAQRRCARRFGLLVKRLMDIVVSATALTLAMPLLALIAVLIKRHDGGKVLFWQVRVGRGGRRFAFPKFRSMVADAERLKASLQQDNDHGDSITFKMKDDPRITPIGRVLRRFSLDELPQLWCVLTGDMSLVGPRPAVPSEVDRYSPSDRLRLQTQPGLTCIWQVSGRGELSFEQQKEMDIQYIQEQSLWLDLCLLVRTVPAVLSGRGAY